MLAAAQALAAALDLGRRPVYARNRRYTMSHQFAIEAAIYGGGLMAANRLRRANILTSGVTLPLATIDGDLNGLRVGTPEIVRRGMEPNDMPVLASLISRALQPNGDPAALAPEVTAFRRRFGGIRYVV